MFSKRFYVLLDIVTKCASLVGACPLKFDSKSQLVFIPKDSKSIQRMKTTFAGLVIWMLLAFHNVFNDYRHQNFSKFIITLVFWIAGITMTATFAIFRFYPHDYCKAINGMLTYFRFIQSKVKAYWMFLCFNILLMLLFICFF